MRLLTVKYLRTAINELDYDDINQMLDTALNLITPSLESLLRTKFSKTAYTDVFYVANRTASLQQFLTALKLSNGLIDPTADFKVYHNTSLANLNASTEETDKSYTLDGGRGILTFMEKFNALWFKVEYTAGIDGDEDEYNEDLVPEWLRNATVVYAQAVFQKLVLEKNSDKEKASSKYNTSLLDIPAELQSMIADHICWAPTAGAPEFTL